MSFSSSPMPLYLLSPSQMVVAVEEDAEMLVGSSSELAQLTAASSTVEVLRAFGRSVGIIVSGSVAPIAAATESYKTVNKKNVCMK